MPPSLEYFLPGSLLRRQTKRPGSRPVFLILPVSDAILSSCSDLGQEKWIELS